MSWVLAVEVESTPWGRRRETTALLQSAGLELNFREVWGLLFRGAVTRILRVKGTPEEIQHLWEGLPVIFQRAAKGPLAHARVRLAFSPLEGAGTPLHWAHIPIVGH